MIHISDPALIKIDLFCRVIDHLGDAGTAWRLCRELSTLRGDRSQIRLFINDLAILNPIAGEKELQCIEIMPWESCSSLPVCGQVAPLIIEMFGCDIPMELLEKASSQDRLIINLDYFSCEAWAVDCHLRESLLGRPGTRKFFFMPGLDAHSGGIMTLSRPAISGDKRAAKAMWLAERTLDPDLASMNWLPVYTYRSCLAGLADHLSGSTEPWLIWALGEATQSYSLGICRNWEIKMVVGGLEVYRKGNCTMIFPPLFSQQVFDRLLSLADMSLVRGEDSLSGALLSGSPFLWQLYSQMEDAHRVKMESFLSVLDPIWSKASSRDLFRESMRAFNFSHEGEGVDWKRFFSELPDMRADMTVYADQLRRTCNLSEKLLKFITLFFQGEIK